MGQAADRTRVTARRQIMDAVLTLDRAVAAAFVCLGVASVVHWLHYRDNRWRWLATALGLFGLVAVVGQPQILGGPVGALLPALSTTLFMGTGYSLLSFRAAFLPLSRRSKFIARTVVPGTTVVVVAITLLPGAGSMLALHEAAWALLAVVWTVCVGEPTYRFWRAARGRPAVQRARLRALATGTGGIILVLLLTVGGGVGGAVTGGPPPLALSAALSLLLIVLVPVIWVSFAPPTWLRKVWRRGEEQALRRAVQDLVMFSADRTELSARALQWAIRLVGADAGVILSPGRQVMAMQGVDAVAAQSLAEGVPDPESRGLASRVVVPIGAGCMVIVGGPFTPLFGSDEIEILDEYASTLALALDRVRVVEDLAEETKQNQSLLRGISDMGQGVLVTQDQRFVYANDAYLDMAGYTADELAALPSMTALAPPEAIPELMDRHRRSMAGEVVPNHFETQLVTKDGRRLDVELAMQIRQGAGGPSAAPLAMTIIRDITDRKEGEARLAALIRADSLTGVGNRHAWDEQLEAAIARARRDAQPLAVAILDLDSFKGFNDDWGHQRGDRLLALIAAAWRAELREVDFLARYGGDEFAMLLPGCRLDLAIEVLERLRLGTANQLAVSIGVAAWDVAESADDVVARADAALYAAKRGGGNRVVGAAPSEVGQPSASWSRRIMDLLARRELEAVYQPIVRLGDRECIGYEALARPLGIAPAGSVEDLFAAAHRLGFSRDLDWLSRRAAVHGAHGLPHGTWLFINVGLWALLDPLHDVDQMLLLLRWAGRDAREVVLEMSEREVVGDLGRLREVLAAYRAEGFRFALDDVGEGHSTLEVLAAAEPEFIKVARSLTVAAEAPGPRSAIRALVTFASSSGAQVIAEGIADDRILAAMVELQVDLGQGFFIGAPAALPVTLPDGRRIAGKANRGGLALG